MYFHLVQGLMEQMQQNFVKNQSCFWLLCAICGSLDSKNKIKKKNSVMFSYSKNEILQILKIESFAFAAPTINIIFENQNL